MKNIVISGGVTKDAVLRRTGNGDAILGFSVAVSEGFGDKKRTLYFDCSVFGARGEKLEQFLTKGTKVSVSGDLSTREYEGKTYITVRADQVTLMGGGEKRDEPERTPVARAADRAQRPATRAELDDEIPF